MYPFDCRICKTRTQGIVRIVGDLLPPGLEVLECTGCGLLGVTFVGETPKANDGVSLD
jgi:hypothetical protein